MEGFRFANIAAVHPAGRHRAHSLCGGWEPGRFINVGTAFSILQQFATLSLRSRSDSG